MQQLQNRKSKQNIYIYVYVYGISKQKPKASNIVLQVAFMYMVFGIWILVYGLGPRAPRLSTTLDHSILRFGSKLRIRKGDGIATGPAIKVNEVRILSNAECESREY